MKNSFRVKANEFKPLCDGFFKGEWEINDVPFCLRLEKTNESINYEGFPIECENDNDKVVLADELSILNSIITNIRPDHLKNLNIYLNPTVLPAKQIANAILIKYNRVMVIQFSYDMITLPGDFELNDNKVIYVARQIDQELKRYLPTDSVVETHLFKIRGSKEDKDEILRLTKSLNQFFSKTTAKELMKLIQ